MDKHNHEKEFEKVKNHKPPKANEEGRTELDEFKDQQHVDDIPLEDLKIEQDDERKKHKTKDDSQSERKFQ